MTKNQLKEALRANKLEVEKRGHDWDYADIVDTVAAEFAAEGIVVV